MDTLLLGFSSGRCTLLLFSCFQAAYYDRAKKLAAAVEGACGDRVSVRRPCGGMFLWVEFRTVEDTEDLVDLMTKHKVRPRPSMNWNRKGSIRMHARLQCHIDVDLGILVDLDLSLFMNSFSTHTCMG